MIFELFVTGKIISGNSQSRTRRNNLYNIRQQVDAQLRTLWQTEPLKTVDEIKFLRAIPPKNDVAIAVSRRGTNFFPLVCQKLSLACRLQIDFYEPEGSLSIVSDVTDIDNRLKTLFDALKMPSEQEMHHDYGDDFYCLLEEDRLVWEVNVKRTRLLREFDGQDSLARITVSTVETQQTYANMAFAAAVVR